MAYVVSSGVTSTGIVLDKDSMTILDGGLAINTTADFEGEMTVNYGGSASGVTVNPWGNLYIFGTGLEVRENGGYVYADAAEEVTFVPNSFGGLVIESRGATVHSGTTAGDIIVSENGEVDVSSGGIVSGATVNPGGAIRSYEGTLSEIRENGGYVFTFGDASFVSNTISGLILESASATLHSGTTANNTVLNGYGILDVFGGSASDVTVNRGGFMRIRDGKVLEVVENGGYVEYYTSGPDENVTFKPNAISGLVLDVACSATLHSGTTAADTTMEEGSLLEVFSGGTANTVQADSGTWLYLHEGVTATGLTLESGVRFDLTVAPGTYVQGTSAGAAFVVENACLENFQADMATEVHVMSGSVSNIKLNFSGFMDLADGSAVGTNVNGGWFYVYGGGAASDTVVSGGLLEVYSGGKVTGTLEIGSAGSVYVDEGGEINADLTARLTSDAALINDITLINGMPAYTITVSATQTEGTYKLAGGLEGFSPEDLKYWSATISTTDHAEASISVGETVTLSGQDYTLNLDAGLLTLTVSCGVPVNGTAGDLNADGRADIIMTIDQGGHPADGSTGAWLIQENQTAAWGDLSTRNPGCVIFGTGKTAVGKNTDDVYIRNSDNLIGAWTTGDDGQVTGWETIGSFDSETQIVGLGDFNGNGQTDLLLRNNNGAVGCFFTGGEKTGWNYFQSLGDEWKLSAIGDLNGDGRDDVVLKHDAGFAGSWLTQKDGTMAWADLDTLADGFEIVGAGDFNGDGTDDVLLKKDNYYGAWLVNDGNAAGWMGLGYLGNVTVEQIADFNGDGTDDLRIRTAAGDLGAQLVMGADTLDWKYYGSVGEEWKTGLAALS